MQALRSHRPRIFLRSVQALAFLALLAFALHTGLGIGGHGLDGFFNNVVYNALVFVSAVSCVVRAVRHRQYRAAWALLGAGLLAWTAAELYSSLVLENMDNPPYPSLSDALWLSFYPAAAAALVLLVRGRMTRARASLWLDGLVAALAVCTIGEATVFHTVAANASANEGALQFATDLAYPIGDMLMLAVVASVFALTAWRPGRAWALIGLGLAMAAVADSIYAYQSAAGTYTVGTLLDAMWPAATLLIGFAAWERSTLRPEPELGGWRILVLPVAFALPALGFLVYDHYGRVDATGVILAALTLLAVLARTAMSFAENIRMLRSSRREALTDSLTGLGNRRRLILDLEHELQGVERVKPRVLAIFDLDGFKRYNDDFGHPAGDALLARLGRNLDAAVRPQGRAYRLGGDEFCALVPLDCDDATSIVEAARAALSAEGEGFTVAASNGLAVLPHDAHDPSTALHVADQRLYENKADRQAGIAGQQTRDALMQALQERQPELHEHVHGVSQLSAAVARRLAVGPEQLELVVRTAELHDVGKMAVPDEILEKPGPLDSIELTFIRQHTIVGERILAAAPALAPVAKLVRSSHESWDGTGYPDGLAGEEIPLPSRIVLACDAYHAMTSDRPYRAALAKAAATAELRRCAGTQFDPRVVDALCQVLEGEDRPTPDLPTLVVPDGAESGRLA